MEQTRQYVGIDLHRHRSVIVRKAADGTLLETTRIDNDPLALARELSKAGPSPEVVLEATQGWYWAADVSAAPSRRAASCTSLIRSATTGARDG